MQKISVVSPVYEAELFVVELCDRVIKSVSSLNLDFELILVDDGSTDKSWKLIEEYAAKDPRVIGIKLSRNFGQHHAITAGLAHSKGDWAVIMDCDLQDPPEKIPALFNAITPGIEIVVAKFASREESLIQQLASKAFWKALSVLAGTKFDPKIGNFRIMSRKVVDAFNIYQEQMRFLGGITSMLGFPSAEVEMQRHTRIAGLSNYNFRKLLSLATSIIVSYSDKPLLLSMILGLILAGLSFLAAVSIFIFHLNDLVEVSGWSSVIISIFFSTGLILTNIGVLGLYLGQISLETKRRPLYIIHETTHGASDKVQG